MDWQKYFFSENEQPLDRFPEGISNTAIFRTMAFVGDSLSSGELSPEATIIQRAITTILSIRGASILRAKTV